MQGLPGPPGEKGENGDVGAMVSLTFIWLWFTLVFVFFFFFPIIRGKLVVIGYIFFVKHFSRVAMEPFVLFALTMFVQVCVFVCVLPVQIGCFFPVVRPCEYEMKDESSEMLSSWYKLMLYRVHLVLLAPEVLRVPAEQLYVFLFFFLDDVLITPII